MRSIAGLLVILALAVPKMSSPRKREIKMQQGRVLCERRLETISPSPRSISRTLNDQQPSKVLDNSVRVSLRGTDRSH